MNWEDTICAIATPLGEAGIGVVRISGGHAIPIAERIFRKIPRGGLRRLPTHTIHYGHVVDPVTGEVLDEVLLSLLRRPKTYTREDTVEISCHGSPLLLSRVVDLLVRHGSRLAEPGEFTRRAFVNGRIDLTQAEAVMDVIRSRTDAALKAALGQLRGRLGREVRDARDRLLSLLAHIEAQIDFSEEGLQVLPVDEVRGGLTELSGWIRKLIEDGKGGRILREGAAVAIVGRPNVGKSSLLNAFLSDDRAIVTSTPGTTRDLLEEWIKVRGLAVKLIDTAGLRDSVDPVEREGVRRAREAAEEAQLILLVIDRSKPLQPEDEELMSWLKGKGAIVVLNKSDLPESIDERMVADRLDGAPVIQISATGRFGLDRLQAAIMDQLLKGNLFPGEGPIITSSRHGLALEKADRAIGRAVSTVDQGLSQEFLAIEVRQAIDHLGEVIGATTTDDLLEQVFSQFCIGK